MQMSTLDIITNITLKNLKGYNEKTKKGGQNAIHGDLTISSPWIVPSTIKSLLGCFIALSTSSK